MDSSDLLIHYEKDNSVVLLAKLKTSPQVTTNTMLPNSTAVDTLVSQYTFHIEFFPDTTYYSQFSRYLYLDSSSFSNLLHKSGIVFRTIRYGFGGSNNYDDLTEKYGVIELSGGCSYAPSELERTYYRLMGEMLKIRNGPNWEQAYDKDLQEKLKKRR